MASTTFVDNSSIIYASWLNDVNSAVYNGTFISSTITPTNIVCNGSVSGTGFSGLVNNTLTSPGAIGNGTPNTGAFTTLSATTLTTTTSNTTTLNTTTLNAFGRVFLSNGSASLPSLTFTNEFAQDTGLYFAGDGYIGFASNGVSAGYITSGGINIGGNYFGGGGYLTGVMNNTLSFTQPSRTATQTYTNNTGHPIFVKIVGTGVINNFILTINGIQADIQTNWNTAGYQSVCGIVPNSGTYSVNLNGGSVYLWNEFS